MTLSTVSKSRIHWLAHLRQEELHACTQHESVQELDPCVFEQVAALQRVAVQLAQDSPADGGGEYAQHLQQQPSCATSKPVLLQHESQKHHTFVN